MSYIFIFPSEIPVNDNPVYATHEDAKQAFKELLREKVEPDVHVYWSWYSGQPDQPDQPVVCTSWSNLFNWFFIPL